jgi:hypothetical protein
MGGMGLKLFYTLFDYHKTNIFIKENEQKYDFWSNFVNKYFRSLYE